MAQVFTGRVVIPGDKLGEYFEAMKKAEEERQPFRDGLDALNHAFTEHLAEKFSRRTANKHASIIQMFIEFLCSHTDVQRLEDVTIGMANSHFQTWYRRKVWDSATDNDRRVALQKFFFFIAMEKGIVNQKVLERLSGVSRPRAVTKVQPIVKRETVVLRSKFAHSKRIYRDLEVPLDSTLYDLAYTIVQAVDFDDTGHAFGFYVTDNHRRYHDASERYELFVDEGGSAVIQAARASSAPNWTACLLLRGRRSFFSLTTATNGCSSWKCVVLGAKLQECNIPGRWPPRGKHLPNTRIMTVTRVNSIGNSGHYRL